MLTVNTSAYTKSAALVFVLVWCLLSPAQTSFDKPQTATDRVEFAKRFLKIFYPELERHNFRVRLQDDLSFDLPQSLFAFDIQLEEKIPNRMFAADFSQLPPPVQYPGRTDNKDLKLLPFDAGFWFDGQSQLSEFGLTAELMQMNRVESLQQEINQHQEWTDEQVTLALKKAGAKYGPNEADAFVKTLPLAAMKELFGETHIAGIRFNLRDKYASGEQRSGTLSWTVYFKCGDDQSKHVIYGASFEPFDGRLWTFDKVDRIPARP